MEFTINYWAVLAAGVVYMVVGFLWYGPVFGKTWKDLMGFTDESMKSMKLGQMQAMFLGFVMALIMAYVLAMYVDASGILDVAGAFGLVFWIWFGFIFTVLAGSFLWEGKPFKLFILNAAEQLVALFLMAVVLVMWP